METLKPILENLLENSTSQSDLFKRNILKEYLQIVILDFLYSHPDYNKLIFYGGSCLAQCFSLPRLSEDLDFVDEKRKIELSSLARDLENYFHKNTDLEVKATVQKFRIYLKFPILHQLGLSKAGETDLLFLKVEIFREFNFCKKYQTEIRPLFRFNRSVLVKTFDLPTLMATKIRAVLNRKWEKTDKKGNVIVKAKGRDYFDLMWYLQKGIQPNMDCLENSKNTSELKKQLLGIIAKLDSKSIQLDLEAFIDNRDFVKNLSGNMKDILKREVEEKLG